VDVADHENFDEKPLTSTMEDYLEAIYELGNEKKIVRVKDIAERLGVRMPTVTSMLKTLGSRGFIDYEKYGYVDLTSEGEDVGREIHRRHDILFRFLTDILSVDPVVADDEACRMEHTLGASTMDSLLKFMEFIQTCPRAGESWLKNFEEFKKNGFTPEKCEQRTMKFSREFQSRIGSISEGDETGGR
jgi:DtxR family Mn-dependent transcriptional regulator